MLLQVVFLVEFGLAMDTRVIEISSFTMTRKSGNMSKM